MSSATLSSRRRARMAYRMANRILLGYFFLFLIRRLLPKNFYERRLNKLHQRNALQVKNTIVQLKGLFTKVGQLLSIMSTMLPEAYATTLESLQDDAPATDFDLTAATIESELGESIGELFTTFNDTPIASASIGQVYKAQLPTGETVAVKVQHADIEALAAHDLAIIERLMKRVAFLFRISGIEHVYEQVKLMIEEELDYKLEARSMQKIGQNLSDFEGIVVPTVFPAYSTSKIIVSSFVEGVKITNTEQLNEWNLNTELLADRLIQVYCKMILEDGFYHADPHPGNVLVNKDGDLVLLDFGATAELNDTMRREIPVLIQHIIRKDTPKILASLQKMGFLGADADAQQVAGQLVNALTNFVQNEIKMDNLNIKDISFDDVRGSSLDQLRKEIGLRELTRTIQVPKDWILLERAIILVHGISATIAPAYNPMQTVRPYLKNLVLKNGGLKTIVIDWIKQQFTTIIQLPTELNTFLTKANQGQLHLQIEDKNASRLYALGHQLLLTLGIISVVLITQFSQEAVGYWTWPTGIGLGVLLILSLWKNRRKKR